MIECYWRFVMLLSAVWLVKREIQQHQPDAEGKPRCCPAHALICALRACIKPSWFHVQNCKIEAVDGGSGRSRQTRCI